MLLQHLKLNCIVRGIAKVSRLVITPTLLLVKSLTGSPRLTLLKALKFCHANASDCLSVIWNVFPSAQSASKKFGPRSELRPAFPSLNANAGSDNTVDTGTYAPGLNCSPGGVFACGLPSWNAFNGKFEFNDVFVL